MNKLTYLLKLTQKELKLVLYDYLKKKKMTPVFEDGFLYAEGNIPILVVSHMDTVFAEQPKILFYNKKEDKIFNPDGGLGGDDRCGVYAILQLLEKFKPFVLFTEDEEFGCIGAEKTIKKLAKPNVKYIIEFDRRGKDDCVFYNCGNKEFIDYIESFGFKTNYGTCSDISVLGSAWNIASVNLCSGFYNEHTKKEYIIFNHLEKTINRSKLMLKAIKKAPYFDYQEKQYISHSYLPIFSTFDEELTDEEWLLWFDRFYGQKLNKQIHTETHKNTKKDSIGKRLVLKKDEKSKKDNKGANNG